MELAHRILPHRSDQRSDSIILYVYNFSALSVRTATGFALQLFGIDYRYSSQYTQKSSYFRVARAPPRGAAAGPPLFVVRLQRRTQISVSDTATVLCTVVPLGC